MLEFAHTQLAAGGSGELAKDELPGLVHAAASVLKEEGKAARIKKQQPLPLSRPPGPPSPGPSATPAAEEKHSWGPAPLSHRRAERRFGNIVKYEAIPKPRSSQ